MSVLDEWIINTKADKIDAEVRWGDGRKNHYVFVKGGDRPSIEHVRTANTGALIGFLAAKLACYAPEDNAIKWALKCMRGK